MKLTGGRGDNGSVMLRSRTHRATATFLPDGTITCEVRPASALRRVLEDYRALTKRHLLLALPRVLGKLALTLIALVVTTAIVSYLVALGDGSPKDANIFLRIVNQSPARFGDWAVMVTLWLMFLALIHRDLRYRPWHAAEHKAYNAFNAGHSDMEHIAQASRLSKDCGTSLLAPLLVAEFVGVSLLGLHQPWLAAHGALTVLLSGILLGMTFSTFAWSPMRSVSFFLQKHWTTKEPTERELRTAHAALHALIAAHEAKQKKT